ncbi:MAG: HAMP domain-containing histidine kinase, partial [Chloroflexi bacterium]|nr:HAMP domain-containing histidine kinase [Chloroflexota bacterium]
PEDRPKLTPIVIGTGTGIAPLLLLNALPFLLTGRMIVPAGFSAIGLVGIPLGFTYAILRHRLFGLDALVRRVLLRLLDVVTFGAIFEIIWLGLGLLNVADNLSGIAAIAASALAGPRIGEFLRDRIDRWLYPPLFEARTREPVAAAGADACTIAASLTRRIREIVPIRWIALVAHPATSHSIAAGEPVPGRLLALDGDGPIERLHGEWIANRFSLTDWPEPPPGIPITGGQGTVGILLVGPRLNDAPLSNLDLEPITILAARAAAPLEAALLREQAEEEQRFRARLSAVARELAAAGSVDQVLQVVASAAHDLLGADITFVWTRPAGGPWKLAAERGTPDLLSDEARARCRPSWLDHEDAGILAGSLIISRERSVTDEMLGSLSRMTFRLGDITSALAVVVVTRFGTDRPFGAEDERRAGEVIEHASGAFERAHAFAQAAEAETLRQINEMREEFLAIVSHDLQNPLTVIRGFAELLEMRLGNSGDRFVTNAIASIFQAVASCQRLIDDLLTSARLEQGHLSLHREPVDLGALLRRLAEGYRVLPEGHRVHVDATETAMVSADVARLEQMIGNLVTNALRYAPTGPVILRARRLSDREASIEVQDYGWGIPPEEQEKIWNRFYRAKSGEGRSRRGAGVGLSIVKTLAELHGGRAEVESTIGRGSVFRIILPILETPAGHPPDPAELPRPAHPTAV